MKDRIIEEYKSGVTVAELVRKYKLSRTTIRKYTDGVHRSIKTFTPKVNKVALGFNVQAYETQKLLNKIQELRDIIEYKKLQK